MAFIERGRSLFADPTLGTAGKTCISCHLDPVTSLGGQIQKFPKFSGIARTVINEIYQVNLCLTKPMKGQALGFDDERMTALVAFLKSLPIGK
jgi:cytochrome c